MGVHTWFYRKENRIDEAKQQPELRSKYIPELGYFVEDNTMPHDIFLGPDVEEMLFSLPETMRFCIKHNIDLSYQQKFKLQKFWFEYRDGMICFE